MFRPDAMKCIKVYRRHTKQVVHKQKTYVTFSHSYMHLMVNNAQTRYLYSAVDKDL